MGPQEDFARLEELGFVRKGFIPPPNEGETFLCLRSGWMIGVPFLTGPYVVFPRDGDPIEVSSLGAAISGVQNAPSLPTAEREALRHSLEDRRPVAERAREELTRLQEERQEIREEMKSREYQQMWREWNRFLLAGARGETPDLSAYGEAKRAYIEAQVRGRQKEEERREEKKRRPRKRVTDRPAWTPERFDPSDLPGLLVALPVAIAMVLLAEWMFIYVFVALSAFVAAVDMGGVLSLGEASGVLSADDLPRALWFLIFACHGVLASAPAAELTWYWTRDRG